jgi:hypothetical protein
VLLLAGDRKVLDRRVRTGDEHALVSVVCPTHEIRGRSVLTFDGEDLGLARNVTDVVSADDDLVTDRSFHHLSFCSHCPDPTLESPSGCSDSLIRKDFVSCFVSCFHRVTGNDFCPSGRHRTASRCSQFFIVVLGPRCR